MKHRHIFFLYVLFIFFAPFNSYTQNYIIKKQNLPQIKTLSSKDLVFTQYIKDRQEDAKTGDIHFYCYKYDPSQKLFLSLMEIATRTLVPEVMLASINGVTRETSLKGKTLILPTQKGFFFTKQALSSLDTLLYAKYIKNLQNNECVCYNINNVDFYYIKTNEIDKTLQAFYMDASMKMPLKSFVVSSSFGNRISPISGKKKFHAGVDLAAPLGTPVSACKSGVIDFCIKGDAVFGNYIGIKHKSGQISIYAHLQGFASDIQKGVNVATGQLIGYVGSTGASTGPHLHFEIKENGKALDPLGAIKKQ